MYYIIYTVGSLSPRYAIPYHTLLIPDYLRYHVYYCILYIYRYEAGNTFNTKYTFPVIPDYQIYHVHCTRTDTLFHLIVLRSGVDLYFSMFIRGSDWFVSGLGIRSFDFLANR